MTTHQPSTATDREPLGGIALPGAGLVISRRVDTARIFRRHPRQRTLGHVGADQDDPAAAVRPHAGQSPAPAGSGS
jgi:hypothetical protein